MNKSATNNVKSATNVKSTPLHYIEASVKYIDIILLGSIEVTLLDGCLLLSLASW